MKKQFILLIVIILTQVCFSCLENNSLKACDATKVSCSAKKNKPATVNQDVYIEDLDASFNMFMNPFSKI